MIKFLTEKTRIFTFTIVSVFFCVNHSMANNNDFENLRKLIIDSALKQSITLEAEAILQNLSALKKSIDSTARGAELKKTIEKHLAAQKPEEIVNIAMRHQEQLELSLRAEVSRVVQSVLSSKFSKEEISEKEKEVTEAILQLLLASDNSNDEKSFY